MPTTKLNINSALEEVKESAFDDTFKKICEEDSDEDGDELFGDESEDSLEYDDDDSEEEPVYNKVISEKDLETLGEK